MSAHAAPTYSAEHYDSKVALWAVLMGSMAGVLMQALDTTIANVALPYMQGSLSASRDQITWVLTSYIVAAAIMTAPVGWIAARFGKKNFLIVSLTGFTVTSMMCGLAQTLDQMIIFRLAQGAFGAALGPLSQSVMLDMYPPQKRGNIMAIWGMGVMLGPILGPTLGGVLTDAYNWRWVFYVNVPFGIAGGERDRDLLQGYRARHVAEIRLVRLRGARHLSGLAPAHARPRHGQGLVRFDGDRHRGRDRRHGVLSLHRAHDDGAEAVHPARDLQRPQLPGRGWS